MKTIQCCFACGTKWESDGVSTCPKCALASRDETIGKLWAALMSLTEFSLQPGEDFCKAVEDKNPDALLAALGVDDE